MAILSTGFGKGMTFIVLAMAKEDVLIENLYDHYFASKKVYNVGDQISEMLLLSCTVMELMTETVNLL